MVVLQKTSKRKFTGGRYGKLKIRSKSQAGNLPTFTKLDEKRKCKVVKGRGTTSKQRLLYASEVNLLDQEKGTTKKAKMLNVQSCPANRNYVRRNILVKGTVVKTDQGPARITSRPGQEGTINAVLVSE